MARAQRIKAGADPDDALNALHASTIGILHRRWQLCATDPSGISADQYGAALAYISCVTRYCEIMGIPLPRPSGLAGVTQAPHIAVSVFARGMLHRCVTRIYFADEPDANAADPVLQSVPAERRGVGASRRSPAAPLRRHARSPRGG